MKKRPRRDVPSTDDGDRGLASDLDADVVTARPAAKKARKQEGGEGEGQQQRADGDGSLPMEVVCEVLQWFGVAELVRARLVCPAWRDLIASRLVADANDASMSQSDSSTSTGSKRLWRRAYFNTWPLPSSTLLPPLAGATTDEPQQQQDECAGERADVDWMKIAIERLKLHRQFYRSQADEAAAVVEDLRDKVGKLREGHLLALPHIRPKREDEEEDEDVVIVVDIEDGDGDDEDDGAGEGEGEGQGELTPDNYTSRRRAAKRARTRGLVGNELNLHTLATLMKETNRRVKAGLAVDQLKGNLDRFLRSGLNNVRSRYARDSPVDDEQKDKATALLAALGEGVLYRHIDIKIKNLDYLTQGRYLVKAVVYSLATGLPLYFSFQQTWLGDSGNLEPDQSFAWDDHWVEPEEEEEEEEEEGQSTKKGYGEMKRILLGTERAALVSDEQMGNFLQAVLNTGDIYVASFID